MSVPATVISPVTSGRDDWGSRPIMVSARTLLPEPDSPTKPTISPGAMSRLIPRSTGWLLPCWPSDTCRFRIWAAGTDSVFVSRTAARSVMALLGGFRRRKTGEGVVYVARLGQPHLVGPRGDVRKCAGELTQAERDAGDECVDDDAHDQRLVAGGGDELIEFVNDHVAELSRPDPAADHGGAVVEF